MAARFGVGVGDLRVANGTGRRRGRRGASEWSRRQNFPSPLRSLDRVRVRSVGRGDGGELWYSSRGVPHPLLYAQRDGGPPTTEGLGAPDQGA